MYINKDRQNKEKSKGEVWWKQISHLQTARKVGNARN